MYVFDVEEKTSFPKIENWKEYNEYFEKIPNDHISVELILDAMIQQVANVNDESVRKSIISGSLVKSSSRIAELSNTKIADLSKQPIYWLRENCLFYEHSNQMAYKFFKHFESSDFENFYKILDVIKLQRIDSFIRKTPLEIDKVQNFYGTNEIYLELISMESLSQELAHCIRNYDYFHRFKYNDENEIIKFSKKENNMLSMADFKYSLRTKLCFRDFMEYVWPEEIHWIQKEEYDYDAMKKDEILMKCKGEIRKMSEENYFRNGSLKKPIIEIEEEDEAELKINEIEVADKSKSKGMLICV